jgi:hypothetical protein
MQQWRRGREATVGRTSGAALMGSLTLAPGVQLIAQTGTQLADVLRATPQARYLGVTMRWMPTRRASPARSAPAGKRHTVPPNAEAVVTNAGEVAITREPGHSAVIVTVDAPATAVVEVASSATNWTPARAERSGAYFQHRLDLPAGTHMIAIRINGGAWRAPKGLPVTADDFGGTVGRVTVP